ncbi:B-cell antigen receptor complex-associated protein alpha chain isoform X2 [Dendropsophus ebraccatus]|uniref:B-cell antigen receptor complex-associated protein alpha chain isoform X2 n=1 Tax=Dendropsophus ebraccatus TaxID=150705 RepID=UPI003832228E
MAHWKWTSPIAMFLILLPVPGWGLELQFVPTSISVYVGEEATIPCNFHRENNEKVEISWIWYYNTVNEATKKLNNVRGYLPDTSKNLILQNVNRTHRGVYQCVLKADNKVYESCGTYLRVKDPPTFLFFNIAERTKNRLITAEGIILFFCAIIPGTFLLYRRCHQAEAYKRTWEAYSTAARATSNDYTPLTVVQLLSIEGARTTM